MLKNLSDEVRTRTLAALRNGTGKIELRTRLDTSQTELLFPSDGMEEANGRDRARRDAQSLG